MKMYDKKVPYEELERRLNAAEEIIEAFQNQQVDAVIGKNSVSILQLHEVKEKLQRSEEWRVLAMEAGGVGLWEYHPETEDIYGSEMTRKLFGVTEDAAEEAPIQIVRERMHPDDQEAFLEAFKDALYSFEDPVFQHDFRVLHPEEEETWVTCRGRTTFRETPEGWQPVHIRGVVLDITPQKIIENQLYRLNRKLERRVSEHTQEADRRGEQLQKLARELSDSEERERRRIADILHDDLQQMLVVLQFRLSKLTSSVHLNPSQIGFVKTMEREIGECVDKSRGLSHELNPPVLRYHGLKAALSKLAAEIAEAHGMSVVFKAEDVEDPASQRSATVIYRAVKELLFNSLKHSGAKSARIAMERVAEQMVVRVEDAGGGADLSEMDPSEGKDIGMGLSALQERIRLLGGEVEIDSAPGDGFRVTLRLPPDDPA